MQANLIKPIVAASLDAIVCADGQGRITLWNPAAERMFGYQEAEAIGQPLTIILREEDRAAHEAGFSHFLKTGKGTLIGNITETTGLRKDGSAFPKEMSLSAEKVEGEWLFTAILRDISERKKAEEKLQQRLTEAEETRQSTLYMLEDLNASGAKIQRAKQEWMDTFDALTDPIFLHDAEGNIMRANRAYAKHADLGVKDILGKPYWQVFPKSDRRLHCCAEAGAGGEAQEELPMDDGTVFMVHSYVMGGDAEERVFIHWMEDITERKQSEEAIRESEARLSNMIEKNPYGIIVVDKDGLITLVNQAAADLYDKKPALLMGQPFGRPVTSEGTSEIDLAHQDGSIAQVEMQAVNLSRSANRESIVIFRDMTAQRLAEEGLKQSLKGTVHAIAMAVGARDPYTAGHQQRVAELAVAIGGEMGLDEQQIEGLHMGATIHDIGKIHLPAEILSKPARLSELEYQLVKTHAQVGYDILKDIEFPWPVANIVYQHHERLDGSGYPQGLKGDEICLEARITAVADVVEAMAAHRPYRPALGIDAALGEIKRGRGKQYDKQVADTCLNIFQSGEFAFE